MAKLERLEKRFEQQKREIALLEARKREQQDVLYLANRYNRNKDVIEEVEIEIADLEAKISKRPPKSSNNLILQLPVRPIKHKNPDFANSNFIWKSNYLFEPQSHENIPQFIYMSRVVQK